MPGASFVQTSFLGGEWSQHVQGRMDSERYKTAMAKCFNSYPVEEGSWHRRQGTRYVAHTKGGAAGRLTGFDFSTDTPYQMEWTDGYLRFYRGTSLVFTDPEAGIVNISATTPAVVETGVPHGWSTGNTVMFLLACPPPNGALLCNRQFIITVVDAFHFSIADALTGAAINGADVDWTVDTTGENDALRVLELTTPYTSGAWSQIRIVPSSENVLVLHPTIKPYLLAEGGSFFTLSAQDFTDGPYLDENTTSTTFAVSGTSGSVTLTASSIVGVNDGDGFAATDIGRLVRLRSAPAAWNSGTTYAIGATVLGTDDLIYTSLTASNINHDPTADAVNWALSGTGFVWSWLKITAWTSTTQVTATIMGATLLNTTATTHWRMGVFSDTTGWPTCGALHEGRLWLAGPVANRIDGSKVGFHFDFTPTSVDGTVADDNAVSAVADATLVQAIFWMKTDDQGLMFGTQAGEWRVRASNNDDPITPTDIQMREVTHIGSFNQEPTQTDRTILFIQRHKRKVMEFGYYQEVGGFHAPNLTKTAAHLTAVGIEEITYASEPQPMVWARRTDGALIAAAYKRDPDQYYAAWNEHELANGRLVESISSGPSPDGLGQNVFLVTNDEDTDIRWVEQLSDFFDDSKADWQANFVDHSVTPCCAKELSIAGGDAIDGVRVYGLWHLNGEVVDPVIGGMDVGSFTVTNGVIDIPFNETIGFTEAFLASISDDIYGDFALTFDFGSSAGAPVTITSGSVMHYHHTDAAVVGYNGSQVAPDFDNNRIYFLQPAGGATSGVMKFELDPSGAGNQFGGAELLQKAKAAIPATEMGATNGGAFCVSADGNYLHWVSEAGNSAQLIQVSTATLLKVNNFGTAGGSTADSTSSRILVPHVMVSLPGTDQTFLMCGSSSASQEFDVLPVSSAFGANTFLGRTSEQGYALGTQIGKGFDNAGNAYGLGIPGSPTSAAIGIYSVSSGGAKIRTGEFDFADISGAWTRIDEVDGIAFDENDGNLILEVGTLEAVTPNNYIIKITPTGTVLWKYTIPNFSMIHYPWALTFSRIRNSRFFHLVGTTIHIINTDDGTGTTVAATGLTGGGPTISDDVSNSIITYGGFAPGSPQPAYLGEYMGNGGNHTVSGWMRYWVGTITGQPRRPLTNLGYTAPATIGMTYTSRGQLLRPDYGNDAGAANGPAFGKTKRIHQYSASFYRTRGISFGTGFEVGQLYPANLRQPNGSALGPTTLFSSIHEDTLEARYDFENQIAWEITRPWPAIVLAVGGYIQTQDR